MKQNEQQRNFNDVKKENNSNSLSKFYWSSSSASVKSVYFNQFLCLLCTKLFLMLDHTKPHIAKHTHVDAELAGHVHKIEAKLQGLCLSGFSLFPVRILSKPYHFGVNRPTAICESKEEVHTFLYPQA